MQSFPKRFSSLIRYPEWTIEHMQVARLYLAHLDLALCR
jgi:hypothetical protein